MLKFLKLGGSLITDKAIPERAHDEVITRIGGEISGVLDEKPKLRLVIGHGSGSFGHVAANRYQTHLGVEGHEAWKGFVHVAVAAARLNHNVLEALHGAGIPVFRVQPSASVRCENGRIMYLHVEAIERALSAGLVPLVHGDVAFDDLRGGTIVNTEDIFAYLAPLLQPNHILLAGEVEGVYDGAGQVIQHITPETFAAFRSEIGGSVETDVTGGMASKVASMLSLCGEVPHLNVTIFSGIPDGNIATALLASDPTVGTTITC